MGKSSNQMVGFSDMFHCQKVTAENNMVIRSPASGKNPYIEWPMALPVTNNS